jgi:hypothetical protein
VDLSIYLERSVAGSGQAVTKENAECIR